MRNRLLLDSVLAMALAALAIEILLRRWLWQQVPTQVGAVAVYALLVVDGVLIAQVAVAVARRLRRRKIA